MAKKTKPGDTSTPFDTDEVEASAPAGSQTTTTSTSHAPSPSTTSAALVDEFCPRQITFTIPGKVGVQVTATENHGKIEFEIDVLGSGKDAADLRGLFFHITESKLAGLSITGGDGWITGTQIAANSVIDLGHGINMHGKADPFDVGIAFGTPGAGHDFIDGPVHFTLSDTGNDLTLDDIAHVLFGARTTSTGDKMTVLSPAAPDAKDDTYNTNLFEDGASGLNSPSKSPVPIVLAVLANDTDADHDQLFITDVHQDGIRHGTVAIAADGHSILYTPDLDYSGTDSFEYCISDGHGGQDHAVVNLTLQAVADEPVFNVEVLPGADVYHAIVRVTASQNDADSSEFIDRIEAGVPGGLPPGVTITPLGGINPGDQPDQIVREFTIELPHGQDVKFDLNVTAFSQETSNGDEESATQTITIELDFNHNEFQQTFSTADRSIWSNDQAIGFHDHGLIGPDIPLNFHETVPIPIPGTPVFVDLGADVTGHFAFGLNYDIEINGGSIGASAPYHVDLDTTYNRTTDMLRFDGAAALQPGLSFHTEGPGGHFDLDALLDVLLNSNLSISLPVGPDFDVLPSALEHLSERYQQEIVHISDHDSLTLPFPAGLSLTIAFPADVDANGSVTDPAHPDIAHGSDESGNFVQLNWNIGIAASEFVPIIAPLFAPLPVVVPPLVGTITPIVASIGIGADFSQAFSLTMQQLGLHVVLEDNSTWDFDASGGVTVPTASIHEVNGIDGLQFTVAMDPHAQLHNDSDLNFNFSYNLDFLDTHLTVPIPIGDLTDFLEDVLDWIPIIGDVDIPDEISINQPLINLGENNIHVASIDILDNDFQLQFGQQSSTVMVA